MDQQKLDYFRDLLLKQRQQANDALQNERTTALEGDIQTEDLGEAAQLDESRSTSLELASKESQLIKEIDDALLRIDDGTYGDCVRCGKPINEDRLKAIPTAIYDAECQKAIEAALGSKTPSL